MLNNTIENKNLFLMLSLFHSWPLYYYQKNFFEGKNLFLSLNEKKIRNFYKKYIDKEGSYNDFYFRKLLLLMINIYKNENLNEIIKSLEIKGALSFSSEGFFFIKRTMLDNFFYANENYFFTRDMDSKDYFNLEYFLEKEAKIKEFLIKDLYYHFFINLFPLHFKPADGIRYVNNSKIYDLLNSSFSFSDNENIVEEYTENLFNLLIDESIDNVAELIDSPDESRFIFNINILLKFAGEEKIIIPKNLIEYIKEFTEDKDIEPADKYIEKIQKTFDAFVKEEKEEYDSYAIMRKTYGEIENFCDSFINDNKNSDLYIVKIDNPEVVFGINIISALMQLKKDKNLKDAPGLFDLKNKTFYFKKFDNYYDMFKYSGEMFKEFSKVFYKGEEHLFLKKYLTKPFNFYFKNCPVKEKALIIDNYLNKGGFFLSKLLVRLKSKDVKELFKTSYSFYKKEIKSIKESYAYFKKSSIGNLLRTNELIFKGIGDFISAKSYLQSIEKDFFIANKSFINFYKMTDKMLEFVYNNQNNFELSSEEINNIYYVDDVSLNEFKIEEERDSLMHYEKKIRIEIMKRTAYSFYEAFFKLCAFSKPVLKIRKNFINKLKAYLKNKKDEELIKSSLHNLIKFLQDDFLWGDMWNKFLAEEILVFSKDKTNRIVAEIKYDNYFTVIEDIINNGWEIEFRNNHNVKNESYILELSNVNNFNKSISKITKKLLTFLLPNKELELKLKKNKRTISLHKR